MHEDIKIKVADADDEKYVDTIIDTIREAAKKRGTGIAERVKMYSELIGNYKNYRIKSR